MTLKVLSKNILVSYQQFHWNEKQENKLYLVWLQYEEQYRVFCKLLKASRKEVPLNEIVNCIEQIVVDVDGGIMVKWTK